MIIAPTYVYQQIAVIQGWQGTDSDFNSESIFFTLPIDGKDETAMFDTGSYALALPQSIGNALHLPDLWDTTMGGIDGHVQKAYWSKVSIQIGNQVFDNVWCTVGGTDVIMFGMEFFRDNNVSFSIDTVTNQIDFMKKVEVTNGSIDNRFTWWSQFQENNY